MVESREEDTSLQTLLRHVESPFVVRGREEGRERRILLYSYFSNLILVLAHYSLPNVWRPPEHENITGTLCSLFKF